MKYLILLSLSLWACLSTDSTVVSTWTLYMNSIDYQHSYTFNGILDPYVIATIITMETTSDYELRTSV